MFDGRLFIAEMAEDTPLIKFNIISSRKKNCTICINKKIIGNKKVEKLMKTDMY